MALLNSGLPGASSPPGLLPGLPAQRCCCRSGSRRRLSPGLCTPHGAGVPARPRGQGARHTHGRSRRCEAEAASGCSAHRRGCGGDSGLALAPPPRCGPLGCPAPGPRTGNIKGTLGPGVGPYLPGDPPQPPGPAQDRAPHTGCTVFNVLGSSHCRAAQLAPGARGPLGL